MPTAQKRCAVYTRKSTEAGLEQEFNSLHAQREACVAYINSQKHEGWSCLPDEYDDGGFSGGSMERPGLTKLLADIAAGKIDVVVVYKVDRLTRSLMDFAKIVEMFDRHGASFVSVTQHFNTTNSMGRLTLNVLLSFAQFEREVTSERIRDKIAASKKKGMWMGGFAPMGYDIIDQRLAVNKIEAKIVEDIFSAYLTADSVSELKADLDKKNLRTKSWKTAAGKAIEGVPFSRGRLYHLLKNPLYLGQISHKGEVYKGHHEAIIPKPLWDLVQARLKDQWGERDTTSNRKSPCWLVGKLIDEHGNLFQSTQTKRHGRLYYYYASKQSGWSLPAKEIERIIVEGLLRELSDPVRASELSGQASLAPERLQEITAAIKALELKLMRPGEAPRLKP